MAAAGRLGAATAARILLPHGTPARIEHAGGAGIRGRGGSTSPPQMRGFLRHRAAVARFFAASAVAGVEDNVGCVSSGRSIVLETVRMREGTPALLFCQTPTWQGFLQSSFRQQADRPRSKSLLHAQPTMELCRVLVLVPASWLHVSKTCSVCFVSTHSA